MKRKYKARDPKAKLLYMAGEALQYDGDPHSKELIDFIQHKPDTPHEDMFRDDRVFIQGAVGSIAIYPGWYIFKAFDGSLFVWKPDIFEEYYMEDADG